MTAILLIAVAAGIVLGMRFRVLVLVPCFMLMAVFFAGAGLFSGFGLLEILSAITLSMGALQFGYLGGAAMSLTLLALRAPRLSRLRTPGVGSSSPLGS